MVYLNSGTYWMGDNKNLADEQPAHPVSVSPFYMDVKEIHIFQYVCFVS